MDVNPLPDAASPAAPVGPRPWERLHAAFPGWVKRLAPWLIVALIGCVILRPLLRGLLFPPGCTVGDTRSCTLVRQWSDTISKLGIEPVFPPEEDLHVGDVFAVLTSIAGHENHDPILSKSLKIAHLDLTPALAEVYRQLPVFPETPPPPSQAEAAAPEGGDIFQGAWPRTRLPLVAFPTLTIEHSLSLDGAWGLVGKALGASGSADDIETIELIDTSSYGVPALYATEALESFCRQATEVCSEEGARRLVSYVVGSQFAFATHDGKPVNEVSLYIVDRVYLARTIHEHRGNQTADSANAGAGQDTHVAATTGGQSSILLNQTFTRPVVIGFRAVHVQPVVPGQKIAAAPTESLSLPALMTHALESAGVITAPPPLAQERQAGATPDPLPSAVPPGAPADAPADTAAPQPAPAPPPVAGSAAAAASRRPAPPPAPRSVSGAADDAARCVQSGLSPLLCRSLHPTLQAPSYGNTQGISPEARTSVDSQRTNAPASR